MWSRANYATNMQKFWTPCFTFSNVLKRPPQTRKHCCGNIVSRNISRVCKRAESKKKQTKCFACLLRKRENICQGSKMVLKIFSSIFASREANFASATNVAFACNVSATKFPRQCFLVYSYCYEYSCFFEKWRNRSQFSVQLFNVRLS